MIRTFAPLMTLAAGLFSAHLAQAAATSLTGTLSLGNVTVGQSKTTTLTLKNTSKANVRLDSYWFTGSTDFTVSGGTCAYNSNTGFIVKAGKTCTVIAKFAPKYATTLSSKLIVGYFLAAGWTWEEVAVTLTGKGLVANPPAPSPTPMPSPSPSPSPSPNPTPSPTPTVGWLKVSGNKIVNSAGQQVVLKGVNIADPEHLNTKTWERPGVTARSIASAATDQFHAKVIRLPILPGDPAYPNEGFFSPTNGGETYFKNHIKPLVDELTAKGIYVIIDLHYVSNYDALYSKVEAFWKFMAPKFANNPYVLYEVFNEPIYPDNWTTWKNTIAQPITTLIRTYAPNNLVLVGGPYWSSHISGAVNEPIAGGNVAYVAHVYANQSAAMWESRYGAVADKYPLFVTEWGFESGGTEGGDITFGQGFSGWMAKRNVSWTVWSFDNLWGPRMFNQDWTLKPAPAGMGEFVRDLLAPK